MEGIFFQLRGYGFNGSKASYFMKVNRFFSFSVDGKHIFSTGGIRVF